MTRTEYLAARDYIANLGLTPDNIAGATKFLDQKYAAEGGTPVVASEASKVAAAAVAGNAAREAAITKRAREYTQQNRLNGTPITPEWAREHATAIVDLEAQFEQLNQPAGESPDDFEATMAAKYEADKAEHEASQAAYYKLVDERPARDAAKAAADLAVKRVAVQRTALMGTGLSREEAATAVPDAPADVAAPAPSSLDRAHAALFNPEG